MRSFTPNLFFSEQDGGNEKDEGKGKDGFAKYTPDTLNKRLLYTIIFGSMMDQLGSAGPAIMFQIVFYTEYYVDFLFAGKEPVISDTEFRWIETMVLVTFFVTIGLRFARDTYHAIACLALQTPSNLLPPHQHARAETARSRGDMRGGQSSHSRILRRALLDGNGPAALWGLVGWVRCDFLQQQCLDNVKSNHHDSHD
jgi:hypothetical protein